MKRLVVDACVYNAQREMPTEIRFLHFAYTKPEIFRLDFQDPYAVEGWMDKTHPRPSLERTPLVATIESIIKTLISENQVDPINLVIFTDGENTGPNESKDTLEMVLRQLIGGQFRAAVTINLCTEEQDEIDYYNDIDTKLEAAFKDSASLIDVNQDAKCEANKVFQFNPWLRMNHLNYIAQVAGCLNKDLDKIDEEPLSSAEVDRLMRTSPYLFPADSELQLPDPYQANVHEYKRVLTEAMRVGISKSRDELKHLGKFEGTEEGGLSRFWYKIPERSWIDINYVSNYACRIPNPCKDSVLENIAEKSGCKCLEGISRLPNRPSPSATAARASASNDQAPIFADYALQDLRNSQALSFLEPSAPPQEATAPSAPAPSKLIDLSSSATAPTPNAPLPDSNDLLS
jgi:hypothetical protein